MIFSETYKKYAWKFIGENYRKNLKVYSLKFLKVLAKYEKILLKSDGSILIGVSNAQESMRNFVLYSCELTLYLNSVSFNVLDTDNNNLFYGDGLQELTKDIRELEKMLSDTSFGLDETALDDRVADYWVYKINDVGFGFSLPNEIKINTEREKMAAMFTDHIVSKDAIPDLVSLRQVKEVCESLSNHEYAMDIYRLALEIYDTVKKQSEPYVTGEIIDFRKSKGLCQDCGGTYKGLFKKKCSICGASQRK